MTQVANQQMHEDHLRWRAENDFWRDEIAVWQAEAAGMVKDLQGIETALRHHEAKLSVHAGSVRLYQQDFGKHEHAIAAVEGSDNPPPYPVVPRVHDDEREAQARLRESHDQLKHKHQTLLAHWASFMEKLPRQAFLTKPAKPSCCGNCHEEKRG
ncbi:MAG: hypothetical protein C0483_10960 [Pirellula sp.]|nr:hypothetical protein [Pirellula sp.]